MRAYLQGWTPLHVAAGHSSSQAHTIIGDLAQGGADLEAADREGRTPLLFALEGNRKDAIDALLHAGILLPAFLQSAGLRNQPHNISVVYSSRKSQLALTIRNRHHAYLTPLKLFKRGCRRSQGRQFSNSSDAVKDTRQVM